MIVFSLSCVANLFNLRFSQVTFPLGFSPSAMQKLAHEHGELGTSRAAASMNVAMCLSSYSTTSLEDVIKVGGDNPYIIQMCVVKDRNITAQLLKRAEGMNVSFILRSFTARERYLMRWSMYQRMLSANHRPMQMLASKPYSSLLMFPFLEED